MPNMGVVSVVEDLVDALQQLYNACEYWEDQDDPALSDARRALRRAREEVK